MEAPHQPRFADPCFADNQRHLAFTIQHALPTIHQRAQFVLAPDECSQSTGCCRFQPPTHSAGLDYPVELKPSLNTLECRRAACLYDEQPRDQPMRILG